MSHKISEHQAQKMDFIVIGAMKAATSTVCAFFEDHRDVYMVPGGEPNYFSRDENYARGPEWYHAHLAPRTTQTLCAEGSNNYASRARFPEAAARMAAYNPDMKIIYMVRHPIERIISAWIQDRVTQRDLVPPTLDRAVQEMPERFIDQSLYWHNLSAYRAHFDDAHIFVGFMEELNASSEVFFNRLTDFLGIAPSQSVARGHLNPSLGKRVPTPAYSAVRRLPFVSALKTVMPKDIKRYVRQQIFSRPLKEKPRFSADVQAALVREITPDSAALLKYCGKPADFWSLG